MLDSLGNSWRPFEGRHYDLARKVASYWLNFVKTGDPNGADYNGVPLPVWRPYTPEDPALIRFADEPIPESEIDRIMVFHYSCDYRRSISISESFQAPP